MKLLITGGAGFIGSNFIHYMLRYSDVEIINYDKLTYAGNLNNLKNIDETRYAFINGDICNNIAFRETLEKYKPEAVIHFAAESHVDNSIKSSQEFLQTNVLGTESVLRATRDTKIKKIIIISTDECYGSLPIPLEATEQTKFDPNSPYSASKAAADMLSHAFYITYGTPIVIVRGSNCYGRFQHLEKFIPRSITNLLSNKLVGVYGNGTNIREWIFVEDFCKGIETALHYGEVGEAYNLGGGAYNRLSNNVIAEQLCQLLNKSPETNIVYITDRLGHDLRYSLDSTKLQKLGWQPQHTLKDGLTKTVEWYKNNEWWWRS